VEPEVDLEPLHRVAPPAGEVTALTTDQAGRNPWSESGSQRPPAPQPKVGPPSSGILTILVSRGRGRKTEITEKSGLLRSASVAECLQIPNARGQKPQPPPFAPRAAPPRPGAFFWSALPTPSGPFRAKGKGSVSKVSGIRGPPARLLT
jgi:hypothetical protein